MSLSNSPSSVPLRERLFALRGMLAPLALVAALALVGVAGYVIHLTLGPTIPPPPSPPNRSSSAPPPPDDRPAAVVARALRVPESQVAPAAGVWPSLEDRSLHPVSVVANDAAPGDSPRVQTVTVRFEADGRALNFVLWNDRPPSLRHPCTLAQAQEFVREVYQRTLGPWPERLLVQEASGDAERDRYYYLTWARFARPGVETGTWVTASVDAEDGSVRSLAHYLPAERHDPSEVRVTQRRAEQTALAEAQTKPRDRGAREETHSRLMLNYGRPPQDGPVWIVRVDLRSPETSGRVGSEQVVVDAVTGRLVGPLERADPSAAGGAGDPTIRIAPGPAC